MNPHTKSQQIEFEVFPKETKSNYAYLADVKTDTSQEPPPINIAFSHQSVIIIFICVIMSLIASFTLGVEKGKLIAKNTIDQQKITLPPEPPKIDVSGDKTLAETTSQAQNLPAKEPPPAAAPAPGYTIQVASLKTQNSAKNLSESLTKKGVSSFIKPSGDYLVVLAGNFVRKEDAQIKLKELKKTFTDCFIKKI